jgi:hypothetical protein
MSDNSISDENSLAGASDGNSVQAGSAGEWRPQSPVTARIQTVHEVDEPNSSSMVRGQGPSELG